MIDTLDFQFNFPYNRNRDFLQSIKSKETKDFRYISGNYKDSGIITYCYGYAPYSFYYNYTHSYLKVEVCPKLILGHSPSPDDCDRIKELCTAIVNNHLNIPTYYFTSIILSRIDFRKDYKIRYLEERNIIYDLMKITREDLYKVVKNYFPTAITYNPEKGWVETITYDKEMRERLRYKYEEAYYFEDVSEFVGIFRTEVRIKNKKLNYRKYTYGESKDLINYLSKSAKKEYWKKYVEKVWFTEPFYRIDIALDMIRKNNDLKNNMKIKLCDVLKSIRRNGFTKARNNYGYFKRTGQIQKVLNNNMSKEEINKLKTEKLR